MKRIAAFVYGIACYGVFLASFLYAIDFSEVSCAEID